MENFTMVGFNYFDVTVSAIILILAFKGLLNGAVKELSSLMGIVGGVFFGSRFSQLAADFIDQNLIHIQNISLLKLLGFMAILLLFWIGTTLIGAILSRLFFPEGQNIPSRFFGLIIGGFKYFIIFALIVTSLSNVTLIRDNLNKYIQDSHLFPLLQQAGSLVIKPKTSVIESSRSVENNSSDTIHE